MTHDARGDAAAGTGEWWVRHAGRKTGPFNVERLRVMAARGALTRFHEVSRDGNTWHPATDLHGVFAAGGRGGFAAGQGMPPVDDAALFDIGTWRGADTAHVAHDPVPPVWSSTAHARRPQATTRVAQAIAVACGVLALMAPTARTAAGALEWWPTQAPLNVAVHALCAATLVAWWVAMAIHPAPALGSALAATSALLAVAVVLPMKEWAPWVAPLAAGLPCCAVLVALHGARGVRVRTAGAVCAIVACVGAVAAALLLWQAFTVWGLVAVMLGGAGSAALAAASVCAVRFRPAEHTAAVYAQHAPPGGGWPFAGIVVAGVGLTGALFAAAIEGVCSAVPMRGAAGAVAALLALALSVLAWAGTHQALASPPVRS